MEIAILAVEVRERDSSAGGEVARFIGPERSARAAPMFACDGHP